MSLKRSKGYTKEVERRGGSGAASLAPSRSAGGSYASLIVSILALCVSIGTFAYTATRNQLQELRNLRRNQYAAYKLGQDLVIGYFVIQGTLTGSQEELDRLQSQARVRLAATQGL